jgi:hypothetical protein
MDLYSLGFLVEVIVSYRVHWLDRVFFGSAVTIILLLPDRYFGLLPASY